MTRLVSGDPGFEAAFCAVLAQGAQSTDDVAAPVAAIIADVRRRGDAALIEYTARLDRFTPDGLRIGPDEVDAAVARVPAELAGALDLAAGRIEAFHRAQLPADLRFTDAEGVELGLRWGPIESVGLYVPGGKAAYPSSVLMNAIPARVAGVGRLAMCVPTPDGVLNPLVLAAARRAGVSEIFRVGGAQAIAAMAFGTASVAAVDRIVGPGNAWVAEAKRQVFGQVGIDGVAGPSEVLIVADAGQDPRRVAVDLLAQAEHDEQARCILLTDDAAFADKVERALQAELPSLARAAVARASWEARGCVIVARSMAEAATLADRVAAEHLQLMVADPHAMFSRIRHAGAAFLGPDCPTALGDYVAGPNHVLPTAGTARFASGLSVYDFLKRTTWVSAGAQALARIGPAAVALAEAEGLGAHARSVALRLGQA